jgi:capsular polysaccharide biosynthesis protein
MASPAPFPARPSARSSAERWYVEALRRRWWMVALAGAVALVAAAVVTAGQRRVYRASATVVVVPTTSVEAVGDVLRTLETLERRTVIATFARVAGSPSVRATVAEKMKRDDGLRGFRIEGSVVPSTNILRIDVEGATAEEVASVANAAAEATRDEVRSLYRTFTTRTLSEATAPVRPIHPDPRRNYVVAALLGAFVGVVAALATAPRPSASH